MGACRYIRQPNVIVRVKPSPTDGQTIEKTDQIQMLHDN